MRTSVGEAFNPVVGGSNPPGPAKVDRLKYRFKISGFKFDIDLFLKNIRKKDV